MLNVMPFAICRAAASRSPGNAKPAENVICTARSIRRSAGAIEPSLFLSDDTGFFSDDTGLAQTSDFFWRIVELAQYCIGVGAEIGGRAAEATRRLGEFDREAEH